MAGGVSDKQCPVCMQRKERSEFHRDASRSDGLDWRCKRCKYDGETALARRRRDARRYARDKSRPSAREKANRYFGSASEVECSVFGCGETADEWHHLNYEYALVVVPLCRKHHDLEAR